MELDGRGRSSGGNNGSRGGARPNWPGRGSVGLGEGTEETRGEVGRLGARGSKARRRGVAGIDRRGERRRAVALLRSRAARGRGRRRENGFGHRKRSWRLKRRGYTVTISNVFELLLTVQNLKFHMGT